MWSFHEGRQNALGPNAPMRVVLVGFGFYALGDENLVGGTILRSICSWLDERPLETVELYVACQSDESVGRAGDRIERFRKALLAKSLQSRIRVQVGLLGAVQGDFDCAIVATPEASHLQVIRDLRNRTNKVIMVKPVGVSLADYNKLVALAVSSGLEIYVDFHKRFDESNIAFVEAVSQGESSSGLFKFSYGQKSLMPKRYFKKWAATSNPFQYLAPHYLDIIFASISGRHNVDFSKMLIDGSVRKFCFDSSDLVSLVTCLLEIKIGTVSFHIQADCNWIEPEGMPYGSRQRIEYVDEAMHYISEQDNRGQYLYQDGCKIPNPHFMTSSDQATISGYGQRSFGVFLDYCIGIAPKKKLIDIAAYFPVARVVEFVNGKIYEDHKR